MHREWDIIAEVDAEFVFLRKGYFGRMIELMWPMRQIMMQDQIMAYSNTFESYFSIKDKALVCMNKTRTDYVLGVKSSNCVIRQRHSLSKVGKQIFRFAHKNYNSLFTWQLLSTN
uniref:AlNc14C665G12364 protein n=1 Tax=Albugo laibachii Nc14 TaxID=890382 RepID=F0X1Q0_9STRA|nr:AlNc14C665G12364 [Albugo laibachii Nc14]|eukprot:CCA27748.1 AlNc14C665G12364 [Albugo laibachii Nc14]